MLEGKVNEGGKLVLINTKTPQNTAQSWANCHHLRCFTIPKNFLLQYWNTAGTCLLARDCNLILIPTTYCIFSGSTWTALCSTVFLHARGHHSANLILHLHIIELQSRSTNRLTMQIFPFPRWQDLTKRFYHIAWLVDQ